MEEIERIVKQKEKLLRNATDDIFDLAYAITMADLERPSWCFIPVETSVKLLLDYTRKDLTSAQAFGVIAYANLLTCVGSWRLTKDIVRLDKTLLEEVTRTEFSGKLPTEVFMHMPAFCTYVEFETEEFIGFFFGLEKSKGDSDPELRIWWVEKDGNFVMTPIHLGDWTLEEAFNRAEKYVKSVASGHDALCKFEDRYINDTLNIILYLCAQNAEYSRSYEKPSRPHQHKTKRGFRFFEADKVRIWHVGEETGQRLREQREAAVVRSGHSLKPHVRRAHWHGFWSGPKNAEKRKFDVKWLPPIFVGVE